MPRARCRNPISIHLGNPIKWIKTRLRFQLFENNFDVVHDADKNGATMGFIALH